MDHLDGSASPTRRLSAASTGSLECYSTRKEHSGGTNSTKCHIFILARTYEESSKRSPARLHSVADTIPMKYGIFSMVLIPRDMGFQKTVTSFLKYFFTLIISVYSPSDS